MTEPGQGAGEGAATPDAAARRVHVSVTGRGVGDAVEELEAAGLEVEEVLDLLGIVTGRARPEAVERMRGVRGVTVEPEADVQLPPPESPLQ